MFYVGTNDFQYINKYLRCSKPIAEALDIIQGEKNMYYGVLLPCLVSLRKKLQKLNKEPLVFCKKLAEKYLESVETQFSEFFDVSSKVSQNAVVAAMSYPRFKDKWLACINIEYHSRIKSVFKGAVVKEIHEAPESFQIPQIIDMKTAISSLTLTHQRLIQQEIFSKSNDLRQMSLFLII